MPRAAEGTCQSLVAVALGFCLSLPLGAVAQTPPDPPAAPGSTLIVTRDRTTIWRREGPFVLAVVPLGTQVIVVRPQGAWYEVQVPPSLAGEGAVGRISGSSVAVIRRAPSASQRPPAATSVVRAPSPPSVAPVPTEPQSAPVASPASPVPPPAPVASPSARASSAPRPVPTGRQERVHGYAEWKRDGAFIVEGQRVVVDGRTKLKLKGVSRPADIPLGYEITAKGWRQPDGSILAGELEAKPNGMAMFEADVIRGAEEMERVFRQNGTLLTPNASGQLSPVGRIWDTGIDVDRVRAVAARVAPPYLGASRFHFFVVDTDQVNAMVLPNGSIWVMRGLLNEVNDDELAVIIGHEFAHYSHEHMRQRVKNQLWVALVAIAASAALQQVSNQNAALGLTVAADLALTAWSNGYTREQEDQADRVGLRYAYEAGFDVAHGPTLWRRMQERHGQAPKVLNLIWGSHSRPSERSRNLETEIHLNYTTRE